MDLKDGAIGSPSNYLQKRNTRNEALVTEVAHWAGAKLFWYHSHRVALVKHGYCSCLSTLPLPPVSTPFIVLSLAKLSSDPTYIPSTGLVPYLTPLHVILFCAGNANLNRLTSTLHA